MWLDRLHLATATRRLVPMARAQRGLRASRFAFLQNSTPQHWARKRLANGSLLGAYPTAKRCYFAPLQTQLTLTSATEPVNPTGHPTTHQGNPAITADLITVTIITVTRWVTPYSTYSCKTRYSIDLGQCAVLRDLYTRVELLIHDLTHCTA